jgi:hypothetical protein
MDRLIVAVFAAALFAAPAFASGCTGIGKGSPPPGSMNSTTTTKPANPCKTGDIYDAATGLCTGTDGKTYKPGS